MADDKKLTTPNSAIQTTGTGKKISINGPTGQNAPLWARAKHVDAKQEIQKKQTEVMATALENRLGLMLDVSGSMAQCATPDYRGRTKIELLKVAVDKFLDSCDFSNTAVAINTFPDRHTSWDDDSGKQNPSLGLTTMADALKIAAQQLRSGGGTPMSQCMNKVLGNVPLTRGIIISDGEADSPYACTREAGDYKEAGVPVDCIHIGADEGGEGLLKEIAEITGGIYIKFKDVEAFARALTYLTPRHRAMLTSGSVNAKEIGADEIKYLGS